MLRVKAVPVWSLAAGLAFALAGCSATGYPMADLAAEINATLDRGRAVTAGDTLVVSFPFKDTFNHQARVRADGTASFLLIDSVAVAGMTLDEIDKRLTKLYADFKQNEEITVNLEIPESAGMVDTRDAAYVVGEVQRPGSVPLSGRVHTLLEVIASAGGHLKATANLSNTILVRRLASGEMRQWRLDADVYQWGKEPPIWLQARDIVFVPNTAIDDVNIWVDKYIRQMLPLPGFTPIP
jgi:protein involved in polysaccharide export with SLBB domain